MKTIISILALSILTNISFAQDTQKEDIIKKAANEMAWGLYSPTGSQQMLANQAERQIKEKIAANPSIDAGLAIDEMINETQAENIEHAKNSNESLKRLNFCEEASGLDKTEAGIYVSRYSAGKVDKLQEGIASKTKQYTAEVYIQASLLGSHVKLLFKASDCMRNLKDLVQESKVKKDCSPEVSKNDSSEESNRKQQVIQE
jgi:hypothetical protein